MAIFETYTGKKAKDIVSKRWIKDAETNLAFLNGDHWQDNKGWVGPRLAIDSKLSTAMLEEVERTFVSHNTIAEFTGRHAAGVVGREPHWKFAVKRVIPRVKEADPITGDEIEVEGQPTAQEQALITEAETLLVEWWNNKQVLEQYERGIVGALAMHRAPFRINIPAGLRDKEGKITVAGATEQEKIAAALDIIYLTYMGFDEESLEYIVPSATVYTDQNTRQKLGIFTYKVEETQEERAELTYLADNGNTVLTIVNDGQVIDGPKEMPLGGRLLMYEIVRKAQVTPQVLSQQKSLNKTLTMKDRNDTAGGYLERIFFNIKWPGKTVTNPDTGENTFVPDTLFTGPGTTNSLQGQTYIDETGATRTMQPSVQFRDPIGAATFIESGNSTYVGILQEVNQVHYSLAGESVVSGESRKQSREAYSKDLQKTGSQTEAAIRWGLETPLALAAFIAGYPGRYDGLRVYVQCKIDAGPVTADDMRAAAEMYDRGLWDWETAVSATGVDDVDAVKQRMERERVETNRRTLAEAEAFPTNDEDNDDGA